MSEPNSITPLSGEIMSAAPAPKSGLGAQTDVVDAEFTTVLPRAYTPVAANLAPQQPKTPHTAGLDILGKSPAPAKWARSGPGFWAGGALAAAAAFWMAGGHSLTRSFSPDAETQVQVASLRSEVRRSSQGAHLVIDGMLENRAATGAKAPDLDIEVAAVGGGVTRYRLGNGGAMIEPRGARNFSSRLVAPATGVRSVSVTVAGGK